MRQLFKDQGFWTKGKQSGSQCHLCKQGPSGKRSALAELSVGTLLSLQQIKLSGYFRLHSDGAITGFFVLFVLGERFKKRGGREKVNVGGKR